MSTARKLGPVIAITGTSLMVGCNDYGGSCGSFGSYGSYGSYGACSSPLLGSPGIYVGSLAIAGATASPQTAVTIIAENGEGRMSGSNDTYYRLNVQPTGTPFSGSFVGYSLSGSLPGGLQTLSGSLSGTVTPSSLNATLTSPGNVSQTLAQTFDSTYYQPSSLTYLAGNWTATTPGLTVTATIQPDGTFIGADSNSCTYSGNFSLIDPNFDTYAETHIRNCSGVTVTYRGLAAFFPGTGAGVAGTPTQIKVLTDDGQGEYLVAEFQ